MKTIEESKINNLQINKNTNVDLFSKYLNYKDKNKCYSDSKTQFRQTHKNEMIKLSNKITNLQTKFEESIIKKNSGDKSEKKYSVSEVSMSKLVKSKNNSKSEFKHKRGVSESDLQNISQK